ncbi:phosphatase PAP2 family protein [Thalassobacillus pellis]|uniref:phosphatase PAP2 family protein n=1 Tax=Thalassobacillus pellis TaxID=748008 RepID=UPI00196103A1|nr:phosphatase PAP2 family protein [Thalassobacillus pellis]MBM7553979.1 undecaprenyl-diphosphatase [Thalassobacillus pellis]
MMVVQQKRITLVSSMALSTVLFIVIALNFKESWMLDFGKWVQSYMYDFLGPNGDTAFVVITYIGSKNVSFPLLAILILVFLFQKRYWTALLLIVNLIGVRQLNSLLKSIFERTRPELEHLVQVSTESFPSGHSMNSIAFFGFLAYLLYLKLKASGKPANVVIIFTGILIVLIGLSRIYLGVHYPWDVIGGFLAGGAWLLFTMYLYTYVPEKEQLQRTTLAIKETSE